MKQFKDVAHLYIGCKVKTDHRGIFTLQGVSLHSSGRLRAFTNDTHLCFVDELTPILRHLADMTLEEYDEVIKMEKIGGGMESMAAATAYALSRHLDLFGLIESGQAIDATTLNPNPYK